MCKDLKLCWGLPSFSQSANTFPKPGLYAFYQRYETRVIEHIERYGLLVIHE